MTKYKINFCQTTKVDLTIIQEAATIYLNEKWNNRTSLNPCEWLQKSSYSNSVKKFSFLFCVRRIQRRKNLNLEPIPRRGPKLAIPVDIQNSIFKSMQHNFNIRGRMPDESQMKKILDKLFNQAVNRRTFNHYKKKTQNFLGMLQYHASLAKL